MKTLYADGVASLCGWNPKKNRIFLFEDAVEIDKKNSLKSLSGYSIKFKMLNFLLLSYGVLASLILKAIVLRRFLILELGR